jgi:hypothetical protein
MSEHTSKSGDDTPNMTPVQTGESSQAPVEGSEAQPEESDASQGASSEAPVTG